MATLSMDEFIENYDTRYIPDHGDVYITYDAVALQLVTPEAIGDPLKLENSLQTVPYNDLTKSWVPIAMTDITAPMCLHSHVRETSM